MGDIFVPVEAYPDTGVRKIFPNSSVPISSKAKLYKPNVQVPLWFLLAGIIIKILPGTEKKERKVLGEADESKLFSK